MAFLSDGRARRRVFSAIALTLRVVLASQPLIPFKSVAYWREMGCTERHRMPESATLRLVIVYLATSWSSGSTRSGRCAILDSLCPSQSAKLRTL